MGATQGGVKRAASSWSEAVVSHGLAPMLSLLEDQALQMATAMLPQGEWSGLQRVMHQGLPIFCPLLSGGRTRIEVTAPGEGEGIELDALLAGLAVTAHAAEYLYFGSDSRFAIADKVRSYKYLVQDHARFAMAISNKRLLGRYEELLGLDW